MRSLKIVLENLEQYVTNPACVGWQESNAISTTFPSTIIWQQKPKFQQPNSNITELIHQVTVIHQATILVKDIFL